MLLAKDGIFPITKDKNGNPLPLLPASGLPFAGTIQGEGKLCGIPSLFVRVAGCNLHCCWQSVDGKTAPCDTTYAAYQIEQTLSLPIEDICAILLQNSDTIRHIVLTGGEPLLQAKELTTLCQLLKKNRNFHFTLETNATLFNRELAECIDLFSSHTTSFRPSVPRLNPVCIQYYIQYARQCQKDFQLKFVYACEEDITEIRELLSGLQGWQNEDILLMPLGGTPEMMRTNAQKTLEYCLRNGWRYCDRLHISLFGDRIGV